MTQLLPFLDTEFISVYSDCEKQVYAHVNR